ncbi:MAG: biotin/lipoyl-binding protein, partial [Chitinophagaceae bacterium]
MKHLLTFLAMAILVLQANAHGGEDHGAAKPAANASSRYFSAEALSDKYEVLVKYGELQGGQKATFQLFLSNARTNRAIGSATISLKVVGQPGIQLQVSRVDTGSYQVSGVFPANKIYDLQVNINSALGPDFLQVAKVEVGKKLAAPPAEAHSHWYDNPWLIGTAGVLAGLLLMFALMRRRNRRVAVAVLTIGLLVPTAVVNPGFAHGGEDHGAAGGNGGGISNTFVIEKESQFLFDILTDKVGPGSFFKTSEILGTVTAAPQGRAVIQTPQTGKIVALRVTPGQSVSKGQVLALVEQQVDAGTQINIISQRNTLGAEVKAAKAQYDRLQSIADIAAKKDVTEARARYESAVQNLRLFNANVGGNLGNTKTITLTAPISGVVGTFNYAIGA